ncbi:MAG: ribulokinase [Firmicutes bacterium]|nr:ribulokinase [Bacillota bacterium]
MSYTIGIDFGTLSARAVIVDVLTGEIVSSASADYAHGVLSRELPDGTPIEPESALQAPGDYIQALVGSVKEAVGLSGLMAEEIIGVGIDATSCTILPVDAAGEPMAFHEVYRSQPQAYIKMWKHHGAAPYAEKLTQAAKEACPDLLARFGGNISAESLFPRMWEMKEKAKRLFTEMDEYMEVADWIVSELTGAKARGKRIRGGCAAGYKAYYRPETGFPPKALFDAARLSRKEFLEKLPSLVVPVGQAAGRLTREMAFELGLAEGIPVAVGMVDAHASVPACGITGPGELLMIIGTSTCQMLLSEKDLPVPGICGAVPGGILPGYVGYEAGQTSVGDLFAYFVDNYITEDIQRAARAAIMDTHTYLSSLAAKKAPGESGLLALDWLNGNRSPLCDYALSGLLLGLTQETRPEDIYRALLESTAYGCRTIVENFIRAGLPVKRILASGGISQKNPFAMQLYADILGMPVEVVPLPVGPAHGSAIFAAVAAGSSGGGYDSAEEAIRAMGCKERIVYRPVADHVTIYDGLYRKYQRLCRIFGEEEKDLMHDLRRKK